MGEGGLSELGDMTFEIEKDLGEYLIVPRDGKGEELGYFDLDSRYAHCGYFQTHSELFDPSKKLGPFVYDMLIELGTLLGGWVAPSGNPSGAIEDKKEGENAIGVWVHYFEKRKDLEKKKINLNKNCFPFDGVRHSTLETLYNNPLYKEKMKKVIPAIMHKYRKKPVFLSQLKKMGKIEASSDILDMIPGKEPEQPKEREQFKLNFKKSGM